MTIGAFVKPTEFKHAEHKTGPGTEPPLEGVIIANVTFEPGCRNFWYVHHKGGQILLATGGCNEWLEPVSDEEYNNLK